MLLKTKNLCITGMHRSGTSLTASWLEHCGLFLYNKMEGGIGNKKGHFEDLDFVRFNEKVIIRQAGLSSKGWIVKHLKQNILFNEEERQEAKKILSTKKNSTSTWGWKDPRTTLLLEEWKRLGNNQFLILWRPCIDVVNSLIRRSRKVSKKDVKKINIIDAFNIWIIYNQNIINFVKKYQEEVILVSLDTLFEKNKEVLEEINKRFSLDLAYSPLNTLYDPTLMNQNNILPELKVFSYFFDYKQIEEQLKEISNF